MHVVAFLNFMSRQSGSIKRLTIIFNYFGQSIKVGLREALTIIKLELFFFFFFLMGKVRTVN